MGRLFEEARVCLPKIYGSAYPVQEFMDDIENYRALSLLHRALKLKLNVLKLGMASMENPVDERTLRRMGNQIQSVGQVCVFHVASLFAFLRHVYYKPVHMLTSGFTRSSMTLLPWRGSSRVPAADELFSASSTRCSSITLSKCCIAALSSQLLVVGPISRTSSPVEDVCTTLVVNLNWLVLIVVVPRCPRQTYLTPQ